MDEWLILLLGQRESGASDFLRYRRTTDRARLGMAPVAGRSVRGTMASRREHALYRPISPCFPLSLSPLLPHRPGIAYTCARTRAVVSRGNPEEKVLPLFLRLTVSRPLCEPRVDRGTELLIWAAASFRGKEGVRPCTIAPSIRRCDCDRERERRKEGDRETDRGRK